MTTHDAFHLLYGAIQANQTTDGLSKYQCQNLIKLVVDAKRELPPVMSQRSYLGSGPQCHSGNVDGGALAALRG